MLTGEHRSPQAPSSLGARSLAEGTLSEGVSFRAAGSHRFYGGVTVTHKDSNILRFLIFKAQEVKHKVGALPLPICRDC